MTQGIIGLNHITLAVSDLQRSLAFYRDTLGCKVRATWPEGVYLEVGTLWLCLSLDRQARTVPHPDYTHIAFSVAEGAFEEMSRRLTAQCSIWRDNKSEGASLYFLDPDGHKLELHLGSLQTRLDQYRADPSKGVVIEGE